MVDDLAASVSAASARARVHTLLVDTSTVQSTLRADHTLGPACGGCADVAGLTLTDGYTIGTPAHAQRPTWAREAGVGGPLGPEGSCQRECVSQVSVSCRQEEVVKEEPDTS